eukprot:319399_1
MPATPFQTDPPCPPSVRTALRSATQGSSFPSLPLRRPRSPSWQPRSSPRQPGPRTAIQGEGHGPRSSCSCPGRSRRRAGSWMPSRRPGSPRSTWPRPSRRRRTCTQPRIQRPLPQPLPGQRRTQPRTRV